MDSLQASAARVANQYPSLCKAVDTYAQTIDQSLDELDTARFWATGIDLLAHAGAFERQNADGTFSEPLEPELLSQLVAVARLHGGFVLGFPRGRELTDRADQARLPPQDILKPATEDMLDAVSRHPDVLSSQVRQFIDTHRETLRLAGWQTARAGYVGYAAIRNLLLLIGRGVVRVDRAVSGSFALNAGLTTAAVAIAQANGWSVELATELLRLLQFNAQQIIQFAAPFPELRVWINHVMELLHIDGGSDDELQQ